MRGTHSNFIIVVISQNSKKSPRDFERPSAITGVKNYQMSKIIVIIKTRENSKCSASRDRDETFNHIKSDVRKLPYKEYKTRHEWVGKEIHWELCKKFQFDHTNKWYIPNQASVRENDTHKL